MKAIVQDRYGSADVLRFEDVALPTVGDDDALVRPQGQRACDRAFARTIRSGKHSQARRDAHGNTRFSPTETGVGGSMVFRMLRVSSGNTS